MKNLRQWCATDWKQHRLRFILESFGTLCITSALLYLSIYGHDANPMYVFLGNIFGAGSYTVVSWMRQSVNFLATNITCVGIATVGMIRLLM